MANEHSQIVPSMQPTAKVADFKFWCQKVLPLVYDDSLSYYEVLNKMVVYLNQVIDNINADIDNVAELEDDFLLLQQYVNNFFDDIDQLVTYTERAEAAQTAAATSAINAASSASNAATSAVNAANSAGSSATSALNAMDAKDAAVAAKTAAEAALANAQTAANNAAASATAAGNSADAASGSAINAAASAASALQNFQLSDAARVAAQEAAEDAEEAAELIDMDATASGVGKAIIVKTVSGGKVTAYEFGESGGGGGTGGIVITIENVPVASFDDGTDAPVVELVVGIEPVQGGSGDPAPDNERPISGWAGANVYVAKKNILNLNNITVYSGSNFTPNDTIDLSTPYIFEGFASAGYYTSQNKPNDIVITENSISFKTVTNWYGIGVSVPLKPSTTYVLKRNLTNCTTQIAFYDRDSKFISQLTIYTDGLFTAPNNAYFGILTFSYNQVGQEVKAEDLQVEVGSVSSDYETGGYEVYEITFPIEAGTVYGGTLRNLGTGEWKLRLDRGIMDLGEVTEYNCTYYPTYHIFRITGYGSASNTPLSPTRNFCSCYKYQAGSMASLNTFCLGQTGFFDGDILVKTEEYTDTSTFKTAMAGQKIVYELATPIEYTLTSANIIELLSGYNNIWADTGDINLLKYIANGKQYVDEKDSLVKALIAKELDSMIADTALVANDFRIVNNTLYKITGNIASGGTLTPGTNCVATTVGEVLKTLLS